MTDPSPDDFYDDYMAWLMKEFPERIRNSDDLIKLFEAAVGFDEFLEGRANGNIT